MSPYDPLNHHRRSIRLKGYDYTRPWAYFITLVTWQRECVFGEVIGGEMRLNRIGKIVQTVWQQMRCHFPNARFEAFIVMPNHVHGIIVLDPIDAEVRATRSLPAVEHNGADRGLDRTRIGGGGSPRQPSSRQTQPVDDDTVRATHPLPAVEYDSADRELDETHISEGGSPQLRPNGPPARSLGAMIGQFKSLATKRIWGLPRAGRRPIWQRNYYEHIIRSEADCLRIWNYIDSNPRRWEEDRFRSSTPPNRFNQE